MKNFNVSKNREMIVLFRVILWIVGCKRKQDSSITMACLAQTQEQKAVQQGLQSVWKAVDIEKLNTFSMIKNKNIIVLGTC